MFLGQACYYLRSDTIETCLTPNHLLFNTTSTAVRNQTILSSTTDKIDCISNHFLDRLRHEYVLCSKFTWGITNIKVKYKLPKK